MNSSLVAEAAEPVSTRPDTDARLEGLAREVRLETLRMIHQAGSGHVGSSMSCVEILTVLRFHAMNWSASRSRRASDVFVLSKGHAVPAWYATLVVGGDLDPAESDTLRTIDSRLQGHPDRRRLDLVDVSTGALGQGLSVAIGRAEGKRLRSTGDRAYCLLGDGELQEGQCWEAIAYAGSRRVGNVVAVVDRNHSQNDGGTADILDMGEVGDKFATFGWDVRRVDGHSVPQLRDALDAAVHTATPSVVVADTRKGHLGPDRLVLNGSHSSALTAADYDEAVAYLGAIEVAR